MLPFLDRESPPARREPENPIQILDSETGIMTTWAIVVCQWRVLVNHHVLGTWDTEKPSAFQEILVVKHSGVCLETSATYCSYSIMK